MPSTSAKAPTLTNAIATGESVRSSESLHGKAEYDQQEKGARMSQLRKRP